MRHVSSWLVESPWAAYTFHARLSDKSLLSEADSVHHQTQFQPKPQGGESELTQWTRCSLHAIFAQMCMITQLLGSKKGRVSNQKWNKGGLLLKCPHIVAPGTSIFLSAVDFSFLDSWGGAKSQKVFYEVYQLDANFGLAGENRCSDKAHIAGKDSCGKKAV